MAGESSPKTRRPPATGTGNGPWSLAWRVDLPIFYRALHARVEAVVPVRAGRADWPCQLGGVVCRWRGGEVRRSAGRDGCGCDEERQGRAAKSTHEISLSKNCLTRWGDARVPPRPAERGGGDWPVSRGALARAIAADTSAPSGSAVACKSSHRSGRPPRSAASSYCHNDNNPVDVFMSTRHKQEG